MAMNTNESYELFRKLADEHDLKFVETTTGMNGYPQNLQPALTGFDNWEQLEKFAEEHQLVMRVLHKRDGWQLYQRQAMTFTPLEISTDDYGDEYMIYSKNYEGNYFENEVKPCLENFDNIDSLRAFLDSEEEIMNELMNCEDDESVVVYNGKYFDTIKTKVLEYYIDTHAYVIGVCPI